MDSGFEEVVHDIHVEAPRKGLERRIAALAGRQRGVVSRRQLAAEGLGRGAIDHRLKEGRLHTLYRGVYLLGHPAPMALAREQGALLACGIAALLSHRSAALVWRLPVTPPRWVEITIVGRHRAQRSGIQLYEVPALHPRDIRRHKGLPLTAPARTLLDIAAAIPKEALEQAVAEAIARHLVTASALREALGRSPRRHGAKALRELLNREAEPAHTRSKAERLMLALVRRHRLPEPAANIQLEEWNVDFLWRDQGLVVEVDSYGFHSSPAAWGRDHRKEADLEDSGLRLRRVTYWQLKTEPDQTARRLKGWLASPGAPTTS